MDDTTPSHEDSVPCATGRPFSPKEITLLLVLDDVDDVDISLKPDDNAELDEIEPEGRAQAGADASPRSLRMSDHLSSPLPVRRLSDVLLPYD